MNHLQMTFSLDNEKTLLCRLPNPRADITGEQVRRVMQAMIEDNVLRVGTARPRGIKGVELISIKKKEL